MSVEGLSLACRGGASSRRLLASGRGRERRTLTRSLNISHFVVVCLLTFWGRTEAIAQNLVSRPAGFIRVAGNCASYLASSPFYPFAPLSNAVLTWDAVNQQYVATSSVSPGQAFWLENESSQDVFLAGEVVLDEARQMVLYPSLNLVGYPYSTAARLEETDLWRLAANGNALLGPLNTSAVPEESALGRGYWLNLKSQEAVVWTEIRPYEDVFPTNDEPPSVKGLGVLPGGSDVVLSISCVGIPSASLDVFYQDLSFTSRFETASGWKLAAADVPVERQEILQWTDLGGADRLPPGEVAGRYYLVVTCPPRPNPA